MDYNDDSWGGDWGSFGAGDTYTDADNTSYVWTGTNWAPVAEDSGGSDSSGGGGNTDTVSVANLMPVPGKPGIFYDPEGSGGFVNAQGNPVTDTGETIEGEGKSIYSSQLANVDKSVIDSLKNAFVKKNAAGVVTGYDWAKIAAMAPMAMSALGLDKKKTDTYQGKIPELSAVRQQINYNDPNRRPGSGGRQYFTDTQYAAKGAEGAAKAVSDAQAQGILSGYTPTAAPTSKWNATNAVATPWVKPTTQTDATPAAASTAPAEPFMSPEDKLASLQTKTAATGGIMEAAKGRYLQGPTDGMADELNTSIDNKQPAKLSHGEFVIPADVVSHLGNGNSDAGAKKLYQMMDKVRQARTGTKKQGKQINPDKYMPGGTVNKYASGGIAQLPIKKFQAGGSSGPATDTTTSGSLSNWAGDYVTNMLGQGQALANQPYQAYTGPLTAGASDLQQQQFAGLSNLAQTGLAPTQFNAGSFDTTAAQKYMNPYLQTALNPQLEEMRRQSQINLQPNLAKLTQAGGYGGGRQAIIESEAARNLLAEQNKTIGSGYASAYDKAMQQFNAEQNRNLDVQRAQQAANEASANYGLKTLQDLGQAGATQRGIESEGIAADKAQFEEQRDYPYKMVQYQQGLLQGLPISAQSNTQNMSAITSLLANTGYTGQLYDALNKIFNPTAATTTTKSAGTT